MYFVISISSCRKIFHLCKRLKDFLPVSPSCIVCTFSLPPLTLNTSFLLGCLYTSFLLNHSSTVKFLDTLYLNFLLLFSRYFCGFGQFIIFTTTELYGKFAFQRKANVSFTQITFLANSVPFNTPAMNIRSRSCGTPKSNEFISYSDSINPAEIGKSY